MLEVRVLGPVEVTIDGTEIAVTRRLERALLVRLALAGGRGVSDDALARDLWGEVELARPVERLRVLASRLRASLGPHASILRRSPAGFSVRGSAPDLTATEQSRSEFDVARRAGRPDVAAAAGTKALEHWRGRSLADLRGVPFGAVEGERLDAARLELQIDLAQAASDRGWPVPSSELARLAGEHPLHERLIGLHALSLYREGQQANALDQLTQLRLRLATELGVDPAPATAELELKFLRHDPAVSCGPARSGLPALRLPEPASAFVGRGDDLAVLRAAVTSPGLVTLIGGPGVGKTRLAREVADGTQQTGRPVAWLDLAPVRDPDAIDAALATSAGLDDGARDSLPRCAESLTAALLVVDNAEHLVDEIAQLIKSLLQAAPTLSILVTSQRPLRLAEEEVHEVGPLPAKAAATLFCARSGAAAGPEADAICAAVDRLPLAIELAAGLTRILTVPQLADRIGNRLRLLTGGMRDGGRRHASLRSALDWSYELLDPQHRMVLRRLAVFAGGCTLEAAEKVLPGDGLDTAEVAPALAELVDRSLLAVRSSAGAHRFGLLEVVRDYATYRLHAAGEEADVRSRHVEWCRQFAAASVPGYSHRRGRLAAIGREEPNLRAAVEWCLAGRLTAVLGIVAPLAAYWEQRGSIAEARRWLRSGLEYAGSEHSAEHARALRTFAALARYSGDLDEARDFEDRALAAYRVLGDDRGIIITLFNLCLTSIGRHEYAEAIGYGERAYDRAVAICDLQLQGASLHNTAIALRCAGRFDDAEDTVDNALRVAVIGNHAFGIAVGTGSLGLLALHRGDLGRSRQLCLEALRQCRDLDADAAQLDMIDGLARLEVAEGRPAEALRLLTVANHHRATLGTPVYVPDKLAERTAALTAARHTVGKEAATIEQDAHHLCLEQAVDEILGSI